MNLIFFPQHFLGIAGMPRRIVDYPDVYAGWNEISTWGAYLTFAGSLLFLGIIAQAFIKKKKAEFGRKMGKQEFEKKRDEFVEWYT